MNIKQMTVTPELAKQFLTKNTNNRNVRVDAVRRYSSDMAAGNFALMPFGIAFLKDGTLADGQHRLLAIIDCGIPQEMMVAFDCEPEIVPLTDTGLVRKEHDRLKMAGFDWANSESVALLRMMLWSRQEQRVMTTSDLQNRLTDGVLEVMEFSRSIFTSSKKGLSSAPIKAAVAIALMNDAGICRNRLAHFAQVLLHGHGNGEMDGAAVTLRNHLLLNTGLSRGAAEREEALKVTQACLKAFLEKKPIRRIPKHENLVWPRKGGAA